MTIIENVVDGRVVPADDAATFPTVDPWTQEAWADVVESSHDDVDAAVDAARRAFDTGPWARMGFAERGACLHRLADLIDEHASDFADCDQQDMGKPRSVLLGRDIPRSADNFRFFADDARLARAESFPMDSGHHAYTRYEPAGVFAAISPWNFPLMLATWKIAPPLAWGNTVVLKPAEGTPASASLLAQLAIEAGMPNGVLNVVHGHGPGAAGEWLTRSSGIDRITFTGESATGSAIMRAAAETLTPISFELGGKGANLVFADADIANAIDWSLRAIFTNSGQVCLAGSRLYVQREVVDEVVDGLVAGAEALRLGDPSDADTDIGPMASAEHHAKVVRYLDTADEDGGSIIAGGRGDGLFVRPTVVTGLSRDARIIQEEIFGPVVAVIPFDTEDDAVAMANDTRYGLNAMVFTENLQRAHRVSARLRAGSIWVNCFYIRDLRAPFGGVGDSGIGREGGDHSREFCTEPKTVIIAP